MNTSFSNSKCSVPLLFFCMIFERGGWIGDSGFGGGAFSGEERRCECEVCEERGGKREDERREVIDLSFGSTPISPLRYEH